MLHIRGLPVSLPSVGWWLERLPLVVLVLSIAFLQGYSLKFWSDLLEAPGWGISIGLEVIHLWAWYRAAVTARFARFGWIVLAVVATGLLLAGALHEVTRPLMQESARIEATDQERQSLAAEAMVLRANLAAFRDMAAGQGRRGWQDDIRRDTARLQEITDRRRSLMGKPTSRRPWLNRITQAGVVGVAVLFQIAAVLAVWSISGGSRKTIKPFRPEPAPFREREIISEIISEKPETFRLSSKPEDSGFYWELWRRVEGHARNNSARLARGNGKISQASLAADLGIKAPDLSAIKLLSRGEQVPRNPSRDSVERLAEMFEMEMPK